MDGLVDSTIRVLWCVERTFWISGWCLSSIGINLTFSTPGVSVPFLFKLENTIPPEPLEWDRAYWIWERGRGLWGLWGEGNISSLLWLGLFAFLRPPPCTPGDHSCKDTFSTLISLYSFRNVTVIASRLQLPALSPAGSYWRPLDLFTDRRLVATGRRSLAPENGIPWSTALSIRDHLLRVIWKTKNKPRFNIRGVDG